MINPSVTLAPVRQHTKAIADWIETADRLARYYAPIFEYIVIHTTKFLIHDHHFLFRLRFFRHPLISERVYCKY